MRLFIAAFLCAAFVSYANACTVTEVVGTHAPAPGFCAGALLFEDTFDSALDTARWRHEHTLAGGGNWEFQWYSPDPVNSYTTGGILHFRPTFTSAIFGEAFLSTGRVIIPPDQCTWAEFYGCDRQGTTDNIINPIRSARITTVDSFSFKFGSLEIRAQMPAGDWLWPALWLMPRFSVFGGWPTSGEIDLCEMRGNRNLFDGTTNVGVNQAGSTMHFGPSPVLNAWPTAHFTRNQPQGFADGFHTYRLNWLPTSIEFVFDGVPLGTVSAGDGFWARGGFAGSGLPNPWTGGTIMAPFDEHFYVILNLAVGGVNFFADHFRNEPVPKPWLNTSPRAAADFWVARQAWEGTWNMAGDSSHLKVDYVRVWAV